MRLNPLFIYKFLYLAFLVCRLYVINGMTFLHGVSTTTKRLVAVYLPVREL